MHPNEVRNPDNLRSVERIIASVVVLSMDDKLLMGRKDPTKGGVFPNVWHIPGGGIEDGESLIDAAKREVFEEVGITLDNEELTPLSGGYGESPKTLSSGEKVWCTMVFNRFEVRLSRNADDVQIKPGDDLVELRWFSKEDLSSVELVPGGHEFFVQAGYIAA